MDRWSGKTAVVTGASSGIGRAIALALAEEGLTVVAVARRDQRLKELASRVEGKGRIHGYTGDITDDDQLKSLFEWVEKNLGPVHVLVNNAGTTIPTRVSEGDMSNWRRMYSLNVFAVGGCIREALASMRRHGVDDGHIVNINSISGHPAAHVPGSWVYASTKHAITVLTEGLMRELVEDKSSIKVTSVNPGVVDTEIFEVGGWGKSYEDVPSLRPEDVAASVVSVISTPPKVLVSEITVRPLGERL